MIFYNHDREVLNEFIKYNPRTCFLMTQLGKPLPKKVIEIRSELSKILKKQKTEIIDANSYVTGKDFLNKIWKIIHSVPFGIAIITEEMKTSTISNIFYEVGVLNALGKETIVVKTPEFKMPSDFVRTEYVEFDSDFSNRIENFIITTFELAEHYDIMAESLEANPNLSIDYWRRAFIITGDETYIDKAEKLYNENEFDLQSKLFVKSFLSNKRKTPTKGSKTSGRKV